MKETIYTIPINDSFSADCECPLCDFLQKEEKNRIEYALGASMMEPDERIKSNELGYCQKHTQMMYNHGNKLSHALVLETRLKYIIDKIEEHKKANRKQKKSIFTSNKNSVDSKLSCTCVVCSRLESIMEAFTSNVFYLYKRDEEFRNKFISCKGFCLVHFELLANSAHKYLTGDDAYEFLNILCDLQKNNLDRVLEDVVWFTKKFDYRYRDEDWKNSKDAVIRASQKISGYIEE